MATVDPRKLLRRLLREPAEAEWIEFKHNRCDPDEIGRCVSACANASMLTGKERAFIIWGIENRTKHRLGTALRLSEHRKGNENFTNWLNRLMEPRLALEFLDFEDEGLSFSILAIDPTYDRPVRFSGSEYIRIGENVKKLSEFPEHERALWAVVTRHRFEHAIALPHQSPHDVFCKLDVDAYFEMSGQEKPRSESELIRHLENVGFVREDWEGGYDITNLGAMLFANNLATFPSIATKAVRVIRYNGRDKRESQGETEGQRGYALGFSGLIKFIMDSLPKKETFRGGVRRLVSIYSKIAVREIVANALIHQDFTISGVGPVIEIYKDRVEVSNPGNSLIERDRLIDERRSRNERLARTMRDLGLCEERGGGIDKAILDIEEKFLPAPEFITSKDTMRVVLFGPISFNKLSKADKVWACFCHCVVRWIQHDYMSNTSLRERFSLAQDDYQAVSAVISDARKANRIVPAEPNQGRWNAKYVPYWAR